MKYKPCMSLIGMINFKNKEYMPRIPSNYRKD